MKKIALIGVFAAVFLYAVAATAYGIHARDSSIRGWAQASKFAATGTMPRALLLRLAGLPADASNPTEINRALRDYVYRSNKVGGNSPKGLVTPQLIFTHLGVAGWDELCGGMSEALAWALNNVGIEARVVQLATKDFVEGRDAYDTHVTVEARIDGKWRISDPTFNVAVSCSDGEKFIAVEGVRACLQRGRHLTFVQGRTQIENRTIASYYAPYRDFFFAYKTKGKEVPADWLAHALAYYPNLQ